MLWRKPGICISSACNTKLQRLLMTAVRRRGWRLLHKFAAEYDRRSVLNGQALQSPLPCCRWYTAPSHAVYAQDLSLHPNRHAVARHVSWSALSFQTKDHSLTIGKSPWDKTYGYEEPTEEGRWGREGLRRQGGIDFIIRGSITLLKIDPSNAISNARWCIRPCGLPNLLYRSVHLLISSENLYLLPADGGNAWWS